MHRKYSLIGTFRYATVAMALFGMLAATGCGGDGGETKDSPRSAVAADIRIAAQQGVPDVVRVTGTVEPFARVSPGTKIMGRIDRMEVRAGDRVSKGMVLARLESRDLDAAVTTAEAAVAMAEANLKNARSQYHRMIDLHQKGSVTRKNLEDATAGYEVAEAALAQAQAGLEAAKVTRSYAVIRSPINGFVVRKMAEAGDMAAPGRALFTLEELSRVKVILKVPESEVVGVSAGSQVSIEVDVLQRKWEAKVDRVIPAADSGSRTYEVHVILPNADGQLRSGMFARGSFERGIRDALQVARTAIVSRGQLDGLFVVDADGVARLRWIRQGKVVDGNVEIISGLSAGERYLISPPAGFVDGTPVEAR